MTAGRPRALFLDRDGTLIRDVGYPRDPATVELLPGVVEALKGARELGYRLVIVSNQSGVARGLIQPSEARAVQERVEGLFAEQGVTFDGAWFCFHSPDDACLCRKPAPGMILEAARTLDLDLGRSVMVGDKASDVDAGIAAGTRAIELDAGRTLTSAGGRGASPTLEPDHHPRAEATFSSWDDLISWLRANS